MNAVHPADLVIKDLAYNDILDSTREFDYFLELAAFACNCPVTAIRIAGKEKHWVKASKDIEFLLQKEHFSFSSFVMEQDDIVIVPDARKDPRFCNDPLVKSQPRLLFFAAAPVISAGGRKLGCLCVMHTIAVTNFSEQQKNALKTIAHLAACLIDLKLNNHLAIQKAGAMIEAEKKVNRLTISEQDYEKGFIADKLQENFAQTLAATKLYLEFAETSKNDRKDHFIQKSRDSISTVINEIRELCKEMVPSYMGQHQETIELLRDMVAEWETSRNIYIDFVCGANLEHLRDHSWFILFHIVQQQLKLAAHCKVKKAEISIIEQDGLTLYFSLSNVSFAETDPTREIILNNIYARVSMVNGQIVLHSTSEGNEVMRVTMPV
jgi:signal transduction histidine kinase